FPPPLPRPPAAASALLLRFDELQNIELLDLAPGEETVDCVLLVAEDFENGGQLGGYQKLDVAPVQVQELDGAAGFREGRGAHDHRAEARAVDVVHVLHVNDQLRAGAFRQVLDNFPEFADFIPHGDAAI